MTGFLWYYVDKINKSNFRYDITGIDNDTLQYTRYSKGEYYGWHTDDSLPVHIASSASNNRGVDAERAEDQALVGSELVRKLSFGLQLSNPEDYRGGQFQFLENKNVFFAPKKRGTLIIFDSRTSHRVLPVKEGVRKSLVGWVVGPRWK
jgi:PKHD-type hydroxylase